MLTHSGCCTHTTFLQGYGPLQSWIYELMLQLHKPTTLPPSPAGFDVTIAPGASAVLDALVGGSRSNRAVYSSPCTCVTACGLIRRLSLTS